MTTLTLRSANSLVSTGATVKGFPLINEEVDNNFSNLSITIGYLSNLNTNDKSNIVNGINEVTANIGVLTNLNTSINSNIVVSINEVNNNIGNIAGLLTTTKVNVVNAINEIYDKAGLDGTIEGVTITNSSWNGNVVTITFGGTGASNSSDARDNLGLTIGANVQAWNSNLDNLGLLAKAANSSIFANGTHWVSVDPQTARNNLGLGNISLQNDDDVLVGNMTANYFIGDGSNLSNVRVYGGSSVISSNTDITLNALSERLQVVSMGQNYKNVILPDPVGMREGIFNFVIKNNGNYRFGIKNNTGNLVSRLDVGDSVSLSLSNITNDTWVRLGSSDRVHAGLGYMPDIINAFESNNFHISTISDTKALVGYWANSAVYISVLEDDLNGNVISGTPVIVSDSVIGGYPRSFSIIALSDTKGIVTYQRFGVFNGDLINLSGNIVTVANSPITINSAVGTNNIVPKLLKYSNTRAILSYFDNNGNISEGHKIRLLDISGGTSLVAQLEDSNSSNGIVGDLDFISQDRIILSRYSSSQILAYTANISSNSIIFNNFTLNSLSSGSSTVYKNAIHKLRNNDVSIILYTNVNSDIIEYTLLNTVDIDISVKTRYVPLFNIGKEIYRDSILLSDDRLIIFFDSGDTTALNITTYIACCKFDGKSLITQFVSPLHIFSDPNSPNTNDTFEGIQATLLYDNKLLCVQRNSSGYAGSFIVEIPK